MPATILNVALYTNTTTLPFTLSAGSNRRIIVDEFRIVGAGNVTAGTGLTLGGVAGRFDGGATANTAYARNAVRKYSWGEAEIAAMSDNTLATVGGSGGTVRFLAYSIQGASQSDAATSNFTHNAAPAVGTGSISLARTDNGFTCANLAFGVNVGATMANPTKAVSGTSNNEHVGYQSDNSGTAAAATFSGNSGLTPYSHLIVNYPAVPPQTITSVNGGAGVKIGSTGNTAITDGFPSAPNAGTFGGKPITVTAYDADTKVATFNGPVVVGGESFPAFTGTQTLVLTNGTVSASLPGVPISPPTGSTLITVASPENVDERAFGHLLVAEGVTPEDGDTFYGVDADVDWLPTTFGSAAALPVLTPVVLRDTSAGIAYELLLQVNGEGVTPPDATPDTGHRTRSLLRVSGSTLTIDGVTHTNGQPISLSPYGGVQSSINGAWLAQSVSASSGSLVVDGAAIVPPKALYLSPAGKLTTTPNGQPVAVVRS